MFAFTCTESDTGQGILSKTQVSQPFFGIISIGARQVICFFLLK